MSASPDVASTSPSRLTQLARLAWPIVIARSTQAVIGLADALMVAPLGEDALAATTTGAMNTLSLIILPMGTVFIVQSFAAQLFGRGDLAGARRYGYYGLFFAAAFGLVALVTLPAVRPLVAVLGLGSTVSASMTIYIQIRLLSVAPVIATEGLGAYYGGLGNTRVSMICGVTAMLSNVLLNYLLIQPRFGLPGYGVAGASAASLAATCVGLLPALVPFLREKAEKSALSGREFWRMLRFGLPNGVNWFLEFGAFVFFINIVIGHLGTTALAAFNVVMQVNSISFMPAFGITSAGAILVGEAIGRNRRDDVPSIVWLTMRVTAAWMLSVGAMYVLVPEALLGFFEVPPESAARFLEIGLKMLGFAVFWQLGDALAMTLTEALRAAGDTTWSMIMRTILAWFVFMPGAYWLIVERGGTVSTAMLTLIGYVLSIAVLLIYRFLSGRWRHIDLVEPSVVD